MALTREQIIEVKDGYRKIEYELESLILDISRYEDILKAENINAFDHFKHGLIRRLFLIKRCLNNFISIAPPENPRCLSPEERWDMDLYLHSFFINIYGAINNLAWIWFYKYKIYEKEDIKSFSTKVDLFGKEFRKYLDKEILEKSTEYKEWYYHFKSFRHPTAHRVPPYIIPYFVFKKDVEIHNSLEKLYLMEENEAKKADILKALDTMRDYEICYADSFIQENKKGPVRFYPQNIADTRTLIELVKIIFERLDARANYLVTK